MKNHKVLLIVPNFFGYEKRIVSNLQGKGYDIVQINARASNLISYKLLLKLMPTVIRTMSNKYFRHAFKKIENKKEFTDVVVIKGDCCSEVILNHMRNEFENAKIHLYLWDSIKNNPGIERRFKYFDNILTFDYKDAVAFGLRFRPLFYTNLIKNTKKRDYDFCFIGTLHGDRYSVLKKFNSLNPNIKSFIYLYTPNFLVRMLRAPKSVFNKSDCFVKYEQLDYNDYLTSMSEADIILDVEHPAQTGATIRSIETIASGKKLVTTNKNILDLPFVTVAQCHIVDRKNPIVEPSFISGKPVPNLEQLTKYFSIEQWFEDIITLPYLR